MTTKNSPDKPPVLRFLGWLLVLIFAALGLAALSGTADEAPATREPTQSVGAPSSERASDSATSMPSTPADMMPPA